MFEHRYQDLERACFHEELEQSSSAPLGCYVSFRERIRERLIAGAIGILLGLAGGAVLFLRSAGW